MSEQKYWSGEQIVEHGEIICLLNPNNKLVNGFGSYFGHLFPVVRVLHDLEHCILDTGDEIPRKYLVVPMCMIYPPTPQQIDKRVERIEEALRKTTWAASHCQDRISLHELAVRLSAAGLRLDDNIH